MTACGYNWQYISVFFSAPSSELSALIEKLQKNADKVEKNIYDVEQNINKVWAAGNTDSLQTNSYIIYLLQSNENWLNTAGKGYFPYPLICWLFTKEGKEDYLQYLQWFIYNNLSINHLVNKFLF